MAEIKITKNNFDEEVLNAAKPILLDFWATWCGPCKMIAPVLAELAEKYEEKLNVGKINVDEEGELATRFQIFSIPTLVLMNKGEAVAKAVGFLPMEDLENWLKAQGVL